MDWSRTHPSPTTPPFPTTSTLSHQAETSKTPRNSTLALSTQRRHSWSYEEDLSLANLNIIYRLPPSENSTQTNLDQWLSYGSSPRNGRWLSLDVTLDPSASFVMRAGWYQTTLTQALRHPCVQHLVWDWMRTQFGTSRREPAGGTLVPRM